MTLQELGALGELIGAVAVVLTLLYVAAQIRQNTRSLRSATSVAVNQALAEINGRWVANADGFTDVWLRGCANLDDLTAVERERFSRQAYDLLNVAAVGLRRAGRVPLARRGHERIARPRLPVTSWSPTLKRSSHEWRVTPVAMV